MKIVAIVALLWIAMTARVDAAESPASLPVQLLEPPRLLTQWAISDERHPLLIAVAEQDNKSSLLIFRREGSSWREVRKITVGDTPINLFVTSEENGYLVSEWATGSGFVVKVFEPSHDESLLREMFEAGSKGLPDVLFSGGAEFDVAFIFRADEQGVSARGGAQDRALIYKLKTGKAIDKVFAKWPLRFRAIEATTEITSH